MNNLVKECLIAEGIITQDQISLAERHAADRGVLLERALLDIKAVTFTSLGRCMSKAFKMPYSGPVGNELDTVSSAPFSMACARKWKAFPVSYDPRTSLLTVAVSSIEQAERLEKIYSLLMEPYDIAFTVAPVTEIENALGIVPEQLDRKKKKLNIASVSGAEGASQVNKKQVFSAPASKQEVERSDGSLPHTDMTPGFEDGVLSDALTAPLINAVSLIVGAHLGGSHAELARIRTRVRYCQLMAVRIGLQKGETVRLVIGAWFSGLDKKREVVRQFESPFEIESLIFGGRDARRDVSAKVLGLVRCYQKLQDETPSEVRDVNMARRGLFMRWEDALEEQELIEKFLQVLMDEQFVDKLGRRAGKVLLVGGTSDSVSVLESALRQGGYDIDFAGRAEEAAVLVTQNKPEAILLFADVSPRDALESCKAIKSAAPLIPIMVLTKAESDVRGAEYLKAGADDLLTLPPDADLLYWKIEKMVSSFSKVQETKKGVSGSLADMNFSDLMQVLSASCRSMEISVKRGDENGKIFMKGGNVVHAETGGLSGENAFYQLMRWNEGEFSMEESVSFPEATISASTMSLLMEGARLVDEAASISE